MPDNSYKEQFNRMAEALERAADGAAKPLKGKSYSLASEDAIIAAVSEIITTLGGEIAHA